MKEMFESILGTFLMMFLIVGSLTCITASIDARHADLAKTEYITRIEDSNFAKDVLIQTFASAEAEGYDVNMTLYRDNENGTRSVIDNIVADDKVDAEHIGVSSVNTTGTYMVRVKLTFDYSFPFVNAISKHEIIGYAK